MALPLRNNNPNSFNEEISQAIHKMVNTVIEVSRKQSYDAGRIEGYQIGYHDAVEDLIPAIADGLQRGSPKCAAIMANRRWAK